MARDFVTGPSPFGSSPSVSSLGPAAPPEHPDNDTLRMLGAFDRKCKVDKHTATNWGYLRSVIDALDAAGQRDAADVLIWQVWHRVNSAARHHEFYGLLLKDKDAVERDYGLLCAEERRLRDVLMTGPSSAKECAEFCQAAHADGDGSPCIDCTAPCDGSGEAGETQRGSTEGDSAVTEGQAPKDHPRSPLAEAPSRTRSAQSSLEKPDDRHHD